MWVLLFSLKSIFAMALAIVWHELGHLIVCKKLNVDVIKMMPLPWGVTIITPLIHDLKSQVLISLAGPVFNFAMIFLCVAVKNIFKISSDFLNLFILSNFAGGFLNLLPVLPLDGGIALKSALCEVLGVAKGFKRCMQISAVLGAIVFAFGIAVVFTTGYNFSYITAGLFILLNLRHERELLICLKKRVLTGEIKSQPKIKYITADASSDALCLTNLIAPSHTTVFLVNKNGRFLGEVSQDTMIKHLLKNSLISIGECIEKF